MSDEGCGRRLTDFLKHQKHSWLTPSEWAPYCFLIIIYLLAFFCLGPGMMLPGNPGFALYICWVCGLIGGRTLGCIGQPPLLGMLIAGILLRNIGTPSLVEPLPDSWATAIRVFGLSVILMRSGLELDLNAIGSIGWACVRLTVCPGCSEAVMVGIAGFIIFGMPITLALSLGFILAAVSPAVVVGGMFELQRQGYGVQKGIPSLVVAAASFDDVVAITGYSLCIGFAISHEGSNIVMEALHGPFNVGLGLILGGIGGTIISYSAMWNTPVKRTLATGLIGLTLAFACNMIHFTGAGALASLVATCVAARAWTKTAEQLAEQANQERQDRQEGASSEKDEKDMKDISDDTPSTDDTEKPGECQPMEGHEEGSDKHHNHEHDPDHPKNWAHDVECNLAQLWSLVAQPLLFCVIGSALNFSEMDAATIPMSIIVILCGVLVRCPVAGAVLFGTDLTKVERTFVGLAWIPKATVQAALGGIPLDVVRTTIDPHHEPELFKKYEKWGLQILTTAVFSILITAPIGLLVIQNLGHTWLSKDVGDEESPEHKEDGSEGQHSAAILASRDTMSMRSEVLHARMFGSPKNDEADEEEAVDPADVDVTMLADRRKDSGLSVFSAVSQQELRREQRCWAIGSLLCGSK